MAGSDDHVSNDERTLSETVAAEAAAAAAAERLAAAAHGTEGLGTAGEHVGRRRGDGATRNVTEGALAGGAAGTRSKTVNWIGVLCLQVVGS